MSQNAEKPALSRFDAPSEADRQQNKKAYRELTSSNKKKAKQPGNYALNARLYFAGTFENSPEVVV